MEIRRLEVLDELIATVKTCISDVMETPLPDDVKEEIAEEVARRTSKSWGGQSVYIPQDLQFALSKRNLEMYEEFDGHNHSHLARKHKISLQQVYKIIKRVREAEHKKNQPSLFFEE